MQEYAYQAQLLIDEMKRRRIQEKLRYYKPHPKQEAFHRCTKRNRWVFGGNRTGKTECGAAEVVWYARGRHPYKKVSRATDGWVVSLTNEVQRDVAQEKVLSYLNPDWIKFVKMREGKADDPNNGVIDFILIESVHGGLSKIGFKSCDQGRERFQGTSKDYIWFDEEPPEDIYMECLMRTLDCKGQIMGTMTPLKGITWVHDKIYVNENKDPEAWCIFMSWEDNPYLSEEERAHLESQLTAEQLESRREGKFIAISGLVYKQFNPDVHVIKPFPIPPEWQYMISIDPGIDVPLSCHWYAVDNDGNVFVVAEHYRAGWMISGHMREIERISNELGWKRDSRGHLSCIMDSAADSRGLTNEKTVAQLFRDHGMNVNTAVNKSRFAGIERVQEYLECRRHADYGEIDPVQWPKGKPRLFIFENCTEMIKEIKKYRWKPRTDDEKEVPIGKDDHAMDELRYLIMTRPEPAKFKPQKEPTWIQKDKLRRARKLPQNRHMRRVS
jgi:phage terminase large subunit-like protein